ncbi:MAG: 30S ribosomal protein S20 [Rickettsiales bacterium]
MANHTSTKKSIRKNVFRTRVIGERRNAIRTYVKKIEKMLAEGRADEAKAFFPQVQSHMAKGVSKGIIKSNSASRKISRLYARLKKTHDGQANAK